MITNAHAAPTQPTSIVLSAILTKTVKDRRGSFTAITRTLNDAGFAVTDRTVSKWCTRDPKLFPAKAAWILSMAHGLGGLSFIESPLPWECDFEFLWRKLSRQTDVVAMNDTTLARVLKISNGAYAKSYKRDYRYFKDNITIRALDDWAQAVGLGPVVLPDSPVDLLPGLPTPQHMAPAAIAFPTYPTTHGVHAPLLRLLKLLRLERSEQHKKRTDLSRVADSDTITSWEQGKLMFSSREAGRDLTLGKLDLWAKELGFGGIVSPQLGALGWDGVLPELLQRVASSDGNPRVMLRKRNLAIIWGSGWRKLETVPWYDMPVVYFEYLSVWAFDQGLAFVGSVGHSGTDWSKYGLSQARADELYGSACKKLRDDVANRGVNDHPLELRRGMSQGTALYNVVAPVTTN